MYNSAPGLNTYLSDIENAEQMAIDADRCFNLLDDDQKISQLAEWFDYSVLCDVLAGKFHEKIESLDPAYLEFLECENKFESMLNLFFVYIEKPVGVAGLQDFFEQQIVEKYEKGEL